MSTTIAIHFKPGTTPEECQSSIRTALARLTQKYETTHLFPDSSSEALRAMFTVKVGPHDVGQAYDALGRAAGVTTVQVSPERSLA